MASFRLLGLSDEQRLEIEQATGIKTEGVRVLLEASLQQAEQLTRKMIDTSVREVQEVLGPHGSVTRLQAGGVKISQGLGVAVYEDGVLKTTIEPDGDLLVGSDITQPSTTSFSVFVNEQTYNNEVMGAGDLLFGDNTDAVSNVKFDASEGQLQFRYGQTVNVYMDTDGSLKAGGGAVILDEDGIQLPDSGDAIVLESESTAGSKITRAHMLMVNNVLNFITYSVKDSGTVITNGDFETGDLTGWTEADPSGKISVGIVDESNVAIFDTVAAGGYSATYIQQTVSEASGVVVRFRARCTTDFIAATVVAGGLTQSVYITTEWRNYIVVVPASTTTVNISLSAVNSAEIGYIDDIVIEGVFSLSAIEPINMLSYLNVSKWVTSGSASQDGGFRAFHTSGTKRHDIGVSTPARAGFNIPGTGGNTTVNATLDVRGSVIINDDGDDADTRIEGDTDANLFVADAGLDAIGMGGAAESGYKLKVHGDVNITSGSTYDIDGTPHTHTELAPTTTAANDFQVGDGAGAWIKKTLAETRTILDISVAETNANDIFRVDSPGGVSAFVGTIATLPGGATLTYNVSSGQELAMVPVSTTQLAKMRLYNTTRGDHALISNCNAGTNTITLTANVPAGWATTDVITIASQTVSGGGLSWVDLEITSGPTNKTSIFMYTQFKSAVVGDIMRIHPFDASFSASKYFTPTNALVADTTLSVFGLQKITNNLLCLAWTGTPTNVIIREAGYTT